MPSNEILSTEQAAYMLGLKQHTIGVLIRRGLLKATKYGRNYLLDPAEVMRYQRERRPQAKPRMPNPSAHALYRREYRRRQQLQTQSKTVLSDKKK